VKCTSADFFRVQPPLGLIKPNDTSRIRVWFQNASGIPTDGKKHYFAIYYMNSTQGKTVKDMWTKDAKHEGRMTFFKCFINALIYSHYLCRNRVLTNKRLKSV
ncbi:hypothetical protein TELCIR_09353, partial [Teladorsagia circumcincta]